MILFCDGFDHYTTLPGKWDSQNNAGGAIAITTASARTGSRGLAVTTFNAIDSVTKNLGKNVVTGGVGFAINISTIATNPVVVLQFLDAGTVQVQVLVNPSGQVIVQRGTTTLGTSTATVGFGNWHYLEVKVKIDGATGTVDVHVDGVSILSLSSQNTNNSGNAFYNAVAVGCCTTAFGGLNTAFFDDLVMWDNTGSFNNTFLGDVSVNAVLPNANGSENDFARGGSSQGTQNYQQVNENPPDDDTSYLFASVVGNIDRYLYPNIVPSTGTPFAVVVWNRARKDDAGARSIRAAVKSGAIVSDSGTDLPLSTSYAFLMGLFETDPNTSAQWTLSNQQAAEFGVKLTV